MKRNIVIWSDQFPEYQSRFRYMQMVAQAWMNTTNCALTLVEKE